MALCSKIYGGLPDWAIVVALVVIGLSVVLAISAMLIPIAASAVTLFRWKNVTLMNLQDDIRHEQAMAYALSKHKDEALEDAKYWLELKIRRIEARISHFFGEKTAVLGLLTTSYVFAKEVGGKKLITSLLSLGVNWGSLVSTGILLVGVASLGLSIGAVMIKQIAARYRYQLDLLEMAQR